MACIRVRGGAYDCSILRVLTRPAEPPSLASVFASSG